MDSEKVIKGLERCLICDISVVAPEEAQNAYRECEYTVGFYCGEKKLLRDALALFKEQEAKIKKYEHLFDFLGIGFREWATKILDGEAEAICEADEHEHKTVITFKLI